MNNDDITKATIIALNKEFYEKFNVKYFTQKVSFLLALLSDTTHLSDIYEKGIEIGDIKATGKKLTEEEENHLQELLKTEISLTYYHAIETFFRLFIAHTFQTESPWVEISSLISYAKFKKDVERIHRGKFPSDKDDLKEVITSVMFGQTPPSESGISKEVWEKNLSNVAEWINLFSGDLLSNQNYNAYKHGLGIFTTQLGFELAKTPLKREKSEVLAYITQQTDGETIQYFKTYTFLDWQQKTALIFKMMEMIENIVLIGERRYLEKKGDVKLHLFHDIKPSDVFKEGIHASEIKMSLPFVRKINKKAK